METKKISEQELAEIKLLQSKFQECIFKLGNLQVEKINLDQLVNNYVENEKKLKDEWKNLQQMEKDLLDKIMKNYGEGNLNINDGTFTTNN